MPSLNHTRYVSADRTLTLTITDVSPQQQRALIEATEAVIAAMPTEPPESPVEGQVWSDEHGVNYEIGPIKWGGALCLRLSDGNGTGYLVTHIADNWTRVR